MFFSMLWWLKTTWLRKCFPTGNFLVFAKCPACLLHSIISRAFESAFFINRLNCSDEENLGHRPIRQALNLFERFV
jgi:hypothetical protein